MIYNWCLFLGDFGLYLVGMIEDGPDPVGSIGRGGNGP